MTFACNIVQNAYLRISSCAQLRVTQQVCEIVEVVYRCATVFNISKESAVDLQFSYDCSGLQWVHDKLSPPSPRLQGADAAQDRKDLRGSEGANWEDIVFGPHCRC